MLTVDDNRAVLCDLSLVRMRFFLLATLFQLNLLYCTRDDLLNKLMGFAVLHFIVVSLSFIREDHITLLWASCILDSVSSFDTLSIFDHMMLGRSIFHVNQTPGWRDFLSIEKIRLRLIIILFLECIE